jgi:hypothetical protein
VDGANVNEKSLRQKFALKKGARGFFEMLLYIYKTTWWYVIGGHNLKQEAPEGRRTLDGNVYSSMNMIAFLFSWGGLKLSPLGTWATIWPIIKAPDD